MAFSVDVEAAKDCAQILHGTSHAFPVPHITHQRSSRPQVLRIHEEQYWVRFGYKLWSVYLAERERHDKALAESWKVNMDGLHIFVSWLTTMHGLFDLIVICCGYHRRIALSHWLAYDTKMSDRWDRECRSAPPCHPLRLRRQLSQPRLRSCREIDARRPVLG